jgi:hypothetical protein
MATVQRRDRQNIHESKDDRQESCHVPELVPVPCSREDTADGVPFERYDGDMLSQIADAREVSVLRDGAKSYQSSFDLADAGHCRCGNSQFRRFQLR